MRSRFFYGWVVVAVAATVVLVTAGVRAAPGTFLLPMTVALAADRFGAHNVGVVYGWILAAHMLGAAIAAWVAGVIRENVGDYAVAFVAAGWIAIVAGFAALMIRRREEAPAALRAA